MPSSLHTATFFSQVPLFSPATFFRRKHLRLPQIDWEKVQRYKGTKSLRSESLYAFVKNKNVQTHRAEPMVCDLGVFEMPTKREVADILYRLNLCGDVCELILSRIPCRRCRVRSRLSRGSGTPCWRTLGNRRGVQSPRACVSRALRVSSHSNSGPWRLPAGRV